jgi:hypothetical protein
MNNTWTKKGSIMKQTAFLREKRRVCSMFKILITYICWKKKYKMEYLEGSGTPVLYIGRTVLNCLSVPKGLTSQKIVFPFWLKLREHLSERLAPTKTVFNMGGKDNLVLYCSGSAQLLMLQSIAVRVRTKSLKTEKSGIKTTCLQET